MNIGFLNTFIVVAETESFTRAAKELGITQPAVSQHIRALEEAYKVRLFQRHAQKVRLTPEGEALKQKAREFFRALAEVQNCMENINELRQGCLTLAVNVFLTHLVSPVVMQFKKLYPGVLIKLYCHNTRKIVRMVSHGDVDFALGGAVAGESGSLFSIPLRTETFALVVRPDHPLAGRDEVTPADLAASIFVVREAGTYTREHVANWFGETPLPTALVETNSLETTYQLVLAGAAAFLPKWMVAEDVAAGKAVCLSCRDFASAQEYCLFVQQKTALSLACRTFLTMLARSDTVANAGALLALASRKFSPPLPQDDERSAGLTGADQEP